MLDFAHIESYKENNRIEAKKALGGLPHSILETYSAFANTMGGIILLGVEEYRDKTFHTVDLPCPEMLVEDFFELLQSKNKVSVNILSENDVTVESINGHRIVAIRVPRAHRTQKPVYIDNDPKNGTYRRSGEGDYRCRPEEVETMLRDAAVCSPDTSVLVHMGAECLDSDSINEYRQRINLSPNTTYEALEDMDDTELLLNVGALEICSNGSVHPTAAGLIMLGKPEAINRQYPNFKLKYIDEATQPPMYFYGKNACEFYFRAYDILSKYEFADGKVISALGEALTNCITNADILSEQGVTVVRRSDRITFTNGGSFRIDVDSAMSGGVSDPRNAGLIRLFKYAGVGSGAGGGIPSIYSTWRSRGWSAPMITESFSPESITLTLPLSGYDVSCTPKAQGSVSPHHIDIIVDHLTRHISADKKQIAQLLGADPTVTDNVLSSMLNDNILQADGCDENKIFKLKA